MDLSSPLRTVSPGLDSAVLQVLAGTESALSASQIARLAPRGTRAGQLPVLNRLVDHGLVVAEPANQGYLYRLNREHVLAGPVVAAANARAIVLERLTAAVKSLRPAPVHVSLFGSFARGEGGPDSDIDLLVITPSDTDLADEGWLAQLDELGTRTFAWTGNRLEHVILTLERLHEVVRAGEPIVRSWLGETQVLSGRPLASLVAGATGTPARKKARR